MLLLTEQTTTIMNFTVEKVKRDKSSPKKIMNVKYEVLKMAKPIIHGSDCSIGFDSPA